MLLSRWRQWDWIAAQRVDAYVANSAITAARIRRYFGRESTILHPPVELARFSPGPVGEHYLVLAELMAHKRIDVAIRAFNALGRPLVVVGDGPEYRRLRAARRADRAADRPASDGEVADLLRTAQALVVTAEEEFGIAAVESLASRAAGDRAALRRRARDRHRGRDGTFYDDGDDPRALAAAVAGFDPARVDPPDCVTSARSSVSSASRIGSARSSTKRSRAAAQRGCGPSRGRALAPQIVTPWRRIHEDPLNPSRRGHNQRNPVASFGLSVVRGRCCARLISPQRSQA